MIGLKIKKPEEKFEILIIIAVLSALCFLEYYFLFILKISTIFTHFFYIPTILACLWWKKRGLIVPIFLTSSLIFFSFFIGLNTIIDNLIRGIIFIFTGYFVGFLSKQISKAEQKIKESEKRYRGFINNISDIILETTLKTKITYISPQCFDIFGYKQEEMIGLSSLNYIHPDDLLNIAEALKKANATGEKTSTEFRVRHKDGYYVPVSVNGQLLKDDKEDFYIAVLRDNTQRKKAEEKIKHISSVLRAISNVNQLIIKEKDRKRLLQGACNKLIETRGYFNVWIAFLNSSNNVVFTAEAGLGENFSPMIELLKKGEMTECSRKAIARSYLIITENPNLTCTDCPLSKAYEGRAAMTIRLEHREKIFGLLSVSIPRGLVNDIDEQNLFKELAGDIALGLYMIDIEEERKKAEQKFRHLFENTPLSIALMDTQGKFLDCNPSAENLFGYKRDEIIGKHFKNIGKFPLNSYSKIMKNFKTIIKGNTPKPLEIPLSKKDGSLISVMLYSSIVQISGKKLFYFVIQDISTIKETQRKIRESEEKHRTILENIKEGYYESDLEGNFTFFNDSWCEITGYPKDELMGLNYRQFLTEETAESVFKSFNEVYKTETIAKIYDFELIKKNGIKSNIELSISIKYDSQNKKCGFYGIARDITEKKKAEALIKKFAEKLEEKVKIRTAELDEAIEKLNETIKQKDLYVNEVLKSSQFKSEFMATMSHELRTPLNAIIGFSDLLAEEIYGSLNKEQKDFIKDVRSSGEHLLNMINQILDISKIESGEMRLNIKKFPLNNLINQIRSTVKPLLDEKKLKFDVIGLETEKFIEADQIRLKEILYNLLGNAIKFTNAGVIKLKFIEKENQLEFDIVDSGIGIAKEDYDLIFKEFKRVDSPFVNSTPGTGLGLPLTKKLINIHGGNISFTSELGKGTTFKFTIPKNLEKIEIKPDSIITE